MELLKLKKAKTFLEEKDALEEKELAVEEKKVLVQEKKDALEEKKLAVEEKMEETKDAVQENPAKKPRWRVLPAAPKTGKKEEDDAAAEHAAPGPAESNCSLSQETLVLGAGSPVVEDLDDA